MLEALALARGKVQVVSPVLSHTLFSSQGKSFNIPYLQFSSLTKPNESRAAATAIDYRLIDASSTG